MHPTSVITAVVIINHAARGASRVYQDESCGDFGVRYYVELREGHDGSGHCIYDYSVDTVSSEPSERLDKSSEFTKEFYDELVNSELIDKGLPWSIEEEDC